MSGARDRNRVTVRRKPSMKPNRLLGEGGGAAGTILGDIELPVLIARNTPPVISALLTIFGLGGAAIAADSASCP